MILQFNFNNKTVDIKVTKKPIKNIYMKIDLNNNINVSAPNNSTDKFILNFVNQHIQTFLEIQNNNSTKVNINLEDKTFYLLGQLENFDIIEKISKQNEVIDYLVFRNKKYKINKKTVEDIIYNIYKKELLLYLTEAQYRKEQLMNVEHHDIYIRMKQNAWASNYVKFKKINYSTRLAAYSPEIIDYVIVHELCHAEHSNHSKDFWLKVAKFEPNFKNIKNKLKSFIYF